MSDLLRELLYTKFQLEELEDLIYNQRDIYECLDDEHCLEYIEENASRKLAIFESLLNKSIKIEDVLQYEKENLEELEEISRMEF